MKINKFFEIKNNQQKLLTKNSFKTLTRSENKESLFPREKDKLQIGNKKFEIEKLLLNKIKISNELVEDIVHELRQLYLKEVQLYLKNKGLLEEIINKTKTIDKKITEAISLKNNSVKDILNVISNKYKNIISKQIIFKDNLNISNSKYTFLNGERVILDNDEFSINEISENYKVEINFKNKKFLDYILLNDKLHTSDLFKVYFMNGEEIIKVIDEISVNENPFILSNVSCNKIIVTGFGAREVVTDIKICAGRNTLGSNKAVCIFECDFTRSKLPTLFLFNCNEDIKIFLHNKKEFSLNEKFTYEQFKEKYYDVENNIKINSAQKLNLQDNVIVAFIETTKNFLQEIKIYGVD